MSRTRPLVGVSPPAVPFAVWIWAAFDPVLIAAAVTLGARADQFGKIFIAAIAALAIASLIDALLSAAGLPSVAPLSREGPLLFPVRSVAAVLWAAAGYAFRRLRSRSSRRGR